MGIDDIISILLFIFFIVIPVLNRLSGSNKQNKPPPPPARPQKGTKARPAQKQGENEAFNKRLEEARKRVLEAMEAQSSSADTAQPPPPSGAPPLVTSQPASGQTMAAPLVITDTEDRPLLGSSQPPQTFLPNPSYGAPKNLNVSQPMRVERSKRKRAKLSQDKKDSGRLLNFGHDEIQKGIIWHQILSKPRSKERFGRKLSRP